MKEFRKILASFAVASALMLSSSAFAGEDDAKVREAGENTITKVEEAVNLQAQGADKTEVEAALREARQLQKEFRYEGTERLRQKAGDKLRAARSQVKNGDPNAGTTLQETLAMYKEMMTVYDANH